MDRSGTFQGVAGTLLDQGYPPLPILPGTKRPAIGAWAERDIGPADVRDWAITCPQHGVGIRLGEHQGVNLIALDLDVPDEEVQRSLAAWIHQSGLPFPVRIGQAPKALLLARSSDPLYKSRSRVFEDESGRTFQVEVLAEGQQFVAFGTHPGTGRPFQWIGADPTTVPASSLPLVSQEWLQSLMEAFEALAEARGWREKARARESAEVVPLHGEYREPLGAEQEQLRQALQWLSAEDYQRWVDVGMALFHETDGSETGLNLWDSWSQGGSTYPGRDELARKWRSFRGMGNRGTLTARSIFHWARREYDEALRTHHFQEAQGLAPRPVTATDTDQLPPRQWVLGTRLLASYVTAVFAPGGVAKSVMSLVTAMSVATGRSLTGEPVHDPGPVWIINNEDDHYELMRRIEGVRILFGVPWDELRGKLYVNSGYGDPIRLAFQDGAGLLQQHPNMERICSRAREHGVRYLVLDPFVSLHDAQENDNQAINAVSDILKGVAARTGAAVEVIHHVRKGQLGDSEAHAGDAEAGRGASALKDAARVVVTLARMSKDTAAQLGLPWSEGRRMVRMDAGKGNFSLPDEDVPWFRLESVVLPSGDSVGVPEPFDMTPYTQAGGEEEDATRGAQWLLDVAGVVEPGDSLLQKDLNGILRAQWGVSETTARRRLEEALPFGFAQAERVETFEGNVLLWRERTGGQTSPIAVRCETG